MASIQVMQSLQVFTDKDGLPLDAGYVYVGEANQNPETKPIAVYWDEALTQPAPQPLRTVNGYIARQGTPSNVYAGASFSLTVRSKTGELVFSQMSQSPDVSLRADLAATSGSSRVGYGAGTVQDALDGGAVSVLSYGAVLNGTTDDSAALLAANAKASLSKQALSIPGVAHIGAATTITAPIVDGLHQMFSTTSQVTINNGLPVRPEWWGMGAGNIKRAVDSLPASGGVVVLENRRYQPSYTGITGAKVANGTAVAGVDYLAKPGVKIIGAGKPSVSADGGYLVDGSGSIVNGPFYVHASYCDFVGFGVDSGLYVCNNLYAGAANDAFAAVQINQSAPVYWTGCHFDQLIGLGKSSSDAYHSMLIEAGDGFSIGEVYGRRCSAGVVLKASNWTADLLDGDECDAYSVLIKSDIYAPTNFFQVDRVKARRSIGAAFRLQPLAATMGGGEVGSVICRDSAIGLSMDGAFIASSINIGSVQTHACTVGVRREIETRGVTIESVTFNNTTIGFDDISGSAFPFMFGTFKCLSTATGVSTNSTVVIDKYLSVSTSGYDVAYTSATARVIIGASRRVSPANVKISSSIPNLEAGWSNFGGSRSTFDVQLDAYGYRLKGLLAPGAINSTICILPPNMRPAQDVLLTSGGLNSGAMVPIFIEVLTNGVVKVANHNLVTIPSGVNLDDLVIPATYN